MRAYTRARTCMRRRAADDTQIDKLISGLVIRSPEDACPFSVILPWESSRKLKGPNTWPRNEGLVPRGYYIRLARNSHARQSLRSHLPRAIAAPGTPFNNSVIKLCR